MNGLVEVILASGIAGIFSALLLVVFVVPAVKTSIEHSYQKLFEKTKTDHELVSKRYDLASSAVRELAVIYEQMLVDLGSLDFASGEKPLTKILNEIHPIYRAKYRILRSQLEPASDILSFYSLSFDALLHPASIKKIFEQCPDVVKASDCKYVYRSVWLSVFECLSSLLRVSASSRFWDREENYADRARAWAEFERKLLVDHFVARFNDQLDDDGYYSLEIEKDGGVDRFWSSLPKT